MDFRRFFAGRKARSGGARAFPRDDARESGEERPARSGAPGFNAI
jgi:hypothetical protein